MKRSKIALASLAIVGMALTMAPINAFASGAPLPRLSGATAELTAVAIAEQTGSTGTAILASSTSYGMVDALTAGPLATYLHAPILLTGAGNTLDADTKAELTHLGVRIVYVTSGTAVISQGVLDELASMSLTVVTLGGVDRAETSVNIAQKMVGVTQVAIANSVQDALSIAAIASAANEPILLTDKDVLPVSVAEYLASNTGLRSSDVIGGTGIISTAVEAAVPGAIRHAGYTAYDTNSQIIQYFALSLSFDQLYLANGVTGIDALAGAPLAARTKSAILLTDGTVPAAAAFINAKLTAHSVVTALGGVAVVPAQVLDGIGYNVPAPVVKPGDFFPAAIGAIWKYQGVGNEYASFSREVLFASDDLAQIREGNGGTVSASVYKITPEAVTRIFFKGEEYGQTNYLSSPSNETLVILKAPLKVGTKWTDPNGTREIVDLKATVTTPANTFTDCLKVKISDADSTSYEYYKIGVGLVEREFISGDTKITSSLISHN